MCDEKRKENGGEIKYERVIDLSHLVKLCGDKEINDFFDKEENERL